MTINLNNFSAIETALFVKIIIPYYKLTATSTPTVETLRFSQYDQAVTIDGELYSPLGNLLSVSDSSSDLRATPGNMSITIAGIPDTSISEIVNSKIKGSSVQVWRVLFDANTKQQLLINGNPLGRFQGIVNNYSLEEDYDISSLSASNRIIITCSSTIDVLSNKISGRKTNPVDQKKLYPTDISMDRVLKLANSNFNFGATI